MIKFIFRNGDYRIENYQLRKDERQNIVFLKTHKCASSTVQNILLRYGYIRNLDFVIPPNSNYLGHPEHFTKSMIPSEMKTQMNKYNIFTHHTRFNYTSIKEIMHHDVTFVTILRDPAELFESSYSYYSLDYVYGGSIREVLRNPQKSRLQYLRFLDRTGINQMSFDLGFSQKYFQEKEQTEKFISEIDKQFNLVMIAEYMEASLVLLSSIMNWPLINVQFLPINVRMNERKTNLTDEERQKIRIINAVDTQLYNFFLKKFRYTIIHYYGIDRMKKDVKSLIELNIRLYTQCVKQISNKGYSNTKSYELKNYDWICVHSTKNELNFTKDVGDGQKYRLKTIKKLNKFLGGNE
ncbi:galactosylceramide sulfotransferase-like [Halyomorpha halys]|uniref:galactosylceramide sulfotransferase-like n=1 Tax=Halyomorpha halys TaxID=286706 RepID=UPI0006D4E98A|nr:galactosylceramide sulfotransferase-like [Halyomorpha halys]